MTTMTAKKGKGGVLSRLPPTLVPYAELLRIHRPLGYYLNISPYVVGIAYSAAISPQKIHPTVLLDRLVILCVWAFFLRSGGCVWDDIIDVDLDRQISRTKMRPLPVGAVSISSAVVLTATIFSCGASVLLFLPRECMYEAGIILIFALLYPFGKRFTDFPQLILGNIAWAIPMAMSSLGLSLLDNIVPTLLMCLFIALVIIMIDLVYSRQDIEDDIKAGVRSMAVHFRGQIEYLAYSLFFSSTLSLLLAGAICGLGFPFIIFSVGGHFFGFLDFLKGSLQEKSAHVESRAKSSCMFASMMWILGLCLEYCRRV